MTTRCLVIGGRGLVGSAMAAHASRLRMRVTVVGRDDYAAQVGTSFDLVVFAGGNSRRYLSERDPAASLDANVGAVHRALRDFPCDSFVLASSVDVYSDRSETRERAPIELSKLSTYALHKRFAEIVVANHAKSHLIVRLGQMVGPGMSKGPVYDVLHGGPLWVSRASSYPVIRTASVAAITFGLLEAGARDAVFNVCGQGSVTLERISSLLPQGRRAEERPGAVTETYAIDVGAARARCTVPSSWDEIRAFVEAGLPSSPDAGRSR